MRKLAIFNRTAAVVYRTIKCATCNDTAFYILFAVAGVDHYIEGAAFHSCAIVDLNDAVHYTQRTASAVCGFRVGKIPLTARQCQSAVTTTGAIRPIVAMINALGILPHAACIRHTVARHNQRCFIKLRIQLQKIGIVVFFAFLLYTARLKGNGLRAGGAVSGLVDVRQVSAICRNGQLFVVHADHIDLTCAKINIIHRQGVRVCSIRKLNAILIRRAVNAIRGKHLEHAASDFSSVIADYARAFRINADKNATGNGAFIRNSFLKGSA